MHKQRWTISVMLLAALLAGGVAACGDKKPSGTGATDTHVGESVEMEITAADGGEIELKEAGIKLAIPAGALGEDTTITAEVIARTGLPETKNLLGSVVELGPSGLTFEKPVALSIDLAGATVPKDAEVEIAYLDEKTDKWVALSGSKLEGDTVTADTMHFSIFAIRLVVKEDGTVVQEGGMCGTSTFKACGGDITGTWNIVAGCADVPDSLLKEVSSQCAGATISFGLDIVGDITFADGKATGTLTSDSELVQSTPLSCTQNMCDTSMPDEGQTIEEKDGACVTTEKNHDVNELDGTYVTEGNTLTINDPADVEDDGTVKPAKPNEYCVTGDTMIVRGTEDLDVVVQWTAKRK